MKTKGWRYLVKEFYKGSIDAAIDHCKRTISERKRCNAPRRVISELNCSLDILNFLKQEKQNVD